MPSPILKYHQSAALLHGAIEPVTTFVKSAPVEMTELFSPRLGSETDEVPKPTTASVKPTHSPSSTRSGLFFIFLAFASSLLLLYFLYTKAPQLTGSWSALSGCRFRTLNCSHTLANTHARARTHAQTNKLTNKQSNKQSIKRSKVTTFPLLQTKSAC